MSVIHTQVQDNNHSAFFGITTTTPPPIDPQLVMQRLDEVNTVQRMLSDPSTSAVTLIGDPGTGKSTLAALLYNRLWLAKQNNITAPSRLLWLGISMYTTLPDVIAAILSGVNMADPSLFLQTPEEQVASLLQALRHPQANALIILDQFEFLLHPETSLGAAGRGMLPVFLDMLQKDLGSSRILLTSYLSPYDETAQDTRVRSYLVSHITMPEGVALLQRLDVQATPEELSLIWQRCSGHVFTLVLLNALLRLSAISPDTLLYSPDYQALWAGDVTASLISGIYHYLNPIQCTVIRALSLFSEPVSLQGMFATVSGNGSLSVDKSDEAYISFERELHVLLSFHIVEQVVGRSEACYVLHPLLRQYVLEHYLEGNEQRQQGEGGSLGVALAQPPLPAGPEAQRIAIAAGHMQVAAYYQQLAREQGHRREQRTGLQDVELLVMALRHLCLGWHWQDACDLLFKEGLHEQMVRWGAWNALIGIYVAMLPPFGHLDRRDEGLVYSHVGMLYGRLGESEQSQSYFEQAIAIQQEINDLKGQAATLANQGELLRMREEYDGARICFENALSLAQQQQDSNLQGIMLHNLGLLYHGRRDFRQAFSYYLEALRLGYNLREQQNRGMVLTNMGVLLYEEGLPTEAMAVLQAALALRQAQQDPTVVLLENFLSALEEKMGSERYARLCQEALKIQKQVFGRFLSSGMRH
jgi:tetratricopeptide (TPR) repeat protein